MHCIVSLTAEKIDISDNGPEVEEIFYQQREVMTTVDLPNPAFARRMLELKITEIYLAAMIESMRKELETTLDAQTRQMLDKAMCATHEYIKILDHITDKPAIPSLIK